MARKKEPERVELNRNRIAEVAKQMFVSEGMNSVNMSDIAKRVNMSKSTLYVYFQNKEQIFNYITLEAMQEFYEKIAENLKRDKHELYDMYLEICQALVEFINTDPISFEMIIKNICVEDSILKNSSELRQIYEIGEKINKLILDKLSNANSQAVKGKTELNVQSVFTLWGALYGLITLAENKQEYIQKSMKITKHQFLKNGFDQLFTIFSK